MKKHYWVNKEKAIYNFYIQGFKPAPKMLIYNGDHRMIFKAYYFDSYMDVNLDTTGKAGYLVIKQVSLYKFYLVKI